MKVLFLSSAFLFSIGLFSQNSEFSGKINNLVQVHDTAFKIVFIQNHKAIDSTETRLAGFFNKAVKPGFYDLEFKKKGYQSIMLRNILMVKGKHQINFSLSFNQRVQMISVKNGSHSDSTIHVTDARKKLVDISEEMSFSSSADLAPSTTATGTRSLSSISGLAGGVAYKKEKSEHDDYTSKAKKDIKSEESKPEPVSLSGIKPGQITAGHWRDLDHWEEWLKTNKLDEVTTAQKSWAMPLSHKLQLKLLGINKKALCFTKVSLINTSNEVVFEAVSDQEGQVYFWPELNDSLKNKSYWIRIQDKIYKNIDRFFNSGLGFQTEAAPQQKAELEIGFVVDATGSMSDEIRYLQVELMDVINRIQKSNSCLEIKTGSVFYRDRGDEYVTRITPLSTNPANTLNFIGNQRAGGGGDFPEAVDLALEAALNQLGWADQEHPKILFLLLDAPPHTGKQNIEMMKKYTLLAAAKGIRIVPIAASGIDKATEFLMKNLAVITNGEYIYITDDSHIGNAHIKPTGGESHVEYLNDLMVEIINTFSRGNWCQENTENENKRDSAASKNSEIIAGHEWYMKFYPNPASDRLILEFSAEAETLKITDLQGKILHQDQVSGKNTISLNVSEWNTGIYLVYVVKGQETISGKLLVMH